MHMVSCQEIVTQLMKKCEILALKNGHSITTTNMLIKSQPDSLNKEYDNICIYICICFFYSYYVRLTHRIGYSLQGIR